MKGEFVQSVTESGELQAIEAVSIIMPKINQRYGYRFKLIGILEHGTIVEKGDSVAALDPSEIYKFIIQQEEALENAEANAEKQQVQSEINRRDLEVQLQNEKALFDLKKLELERMQFESDAKKKVKELEYEKAKMRLSKVSQKLALNPLLDKYDQLINELLISQRQSNIEEALEVLENMVLYSPGNGYFEISHNWNEDRNYNVGDEVSMGRMLASIPDISHMKAKSSINEMDISKMKVGGKVSIRLDALPDITFRGKINQISSMCTEKDGQKIFISEISIEEGDPRLKPGMSVSCEYITYESEEALFVPNRCLLSEGGKTYVFTKKGKNYKKTRVETGVSNANHTIINTKLKAGRELLSLDSESDI
jgi:multidrug efflux pump subunit AcrA (membrane-fusion protein)